jgi:hypothetical protein
MMGVVTRRSMAPPPGGLLDEESELIAQGTFLPSWRSLRYMCVVEQWLARQANPLEMVGSIPPGAIPDGFHQARPFLGRANLFGAGEAT